MDTTNSAITAEELLAHADWVRRLARGLLADPAAVDDAVQQTWLLALDRVPRRPERLRAWLAGIVRNVARHERRAAGRRRRHETALPPGGPLPSTESLVERTELQQQLTAAVLALPEPSRTTVLLRYVEDLSAEEIGRRTGVPGSTVRTRLARGLARLREQLDEVRAGGRAAWLPLLVGLARAPLLGDAASGSLAPAGAAPRGAVMPGSSVPSPVLASIGGKLTAWGIVMTIQGKLVLGAGVVLVLGLALWGVLTGDDGSAARSTAAPVASVDAGAPATAPEPHAAPAASRSALELPAVAAPAPGQPVRVSGRVVDALGAPVPDATLRLLPDGWTLAALGYDESGDPAGTDPVSDVRSEDRHRTFDSPPWNLVPPTTSAADGSFALAARLVLWDDADWASIDSRYPEIVVQHPLHATLHVPCWERAAAQDGFLFDVGTLVLGPGVSVVGRAVDERGEPLIGVDVHVSQRGLLAPDDQMSRRGQPGGDHLSDQRTTSGPDGRFRLAGLWPGEHWLLLELRGVRPLTLPLELLAAEEPAAGVAVRDLGDLVLAAGEALAGIVVDAEGRPIAGAEVRVSDFSEQDWQRDRERQFREPHEAGAERHAIHFEVEQARRGASPPSPREEYINRWAALHGTAVTGADGAFRIDGLPERILGVLAAAPGFEPRRWPQVVTGSTGLRLELAAQGRLHLRCVGAATGRPVLGAEITARRDDDRKHADELEVLPVDGGEVPVVRHVCAADVLLVVSAPGYPRQSLRVAGLPAGHASGERTLALRSTAGSVGGSVRDEDGRPIAGAEITIRPGERGLERSCTTDTEGTFATELLPAGTWRLAAWARGFLTGSTEVTLGAGSEPGRVEFVLERSAVLSGHVLDGRGRPVRYAGLRLSRLPDEEHDKPWGWIAQTSLAGTFLVDVLRPGTYTVQVEGVATVDVTLAPGERRTLEIRAEASPVVHGRVTAGGQPVAGIAVRAEYANDEPDKYYAGITYFESAWTDADGAYELSITRRVPFALRVHSLEHRQFPPVAMDPPTVPRTRVDLELPTGQVPVFVVDAEDGRPLVEATVYGFARVPETAAVEARTDASGRCTLKGMAPGDGLVGAFHPEHLSRMDVPVLVPADGAAAELRVELARGGGAAGFVYAADGSVFSGGPLWLGTFRIDAEGAASALSGWQRAELAEGRYQVANLESGRWLLLVFADSTPFGRELEDLEPAALARLELDVTAGVIEARDLHLRSLGD